MLINTCFGETKQSAKGASRAVKVTLQHRKYKAVLLCSTTIRESMNRTVTRKRLVYR